MNRNSYTVYWLQPSRKKALNLFAVLAIVASSIAPVAADESTDAKIQALQDEVNYLRQRNAALTEEVGKLYEQLDAVNSANSKPLISGTGWVDNITPQNLARGAGTVGKVITAPIRGAGRLAADAMNDACARDQRDAEYKQWLKYNHPDVYMIQDQNDRQRKFIQQQQFWDSLKPKQPAPPVYIFAPYGGY